MTYPRAKLSLRKLPDSEARAIRRDAIRRAEARRMIDKGRQILATTPAPRSHAKRLGIHHSRAAAIARGTAYKDVVL